MQCRVLQQEASSAHVKFGWCRLETRAAVHWLLPLLSFSGRFEDWSKILLVRSMWRGASPHTSCIKVSVLGPWPVALNAVRVPLIRFGNGQLTQASLPAPPPLLLQIRQLLQGRCRSIGGVTAVWVGRLHDELASIEACHRLFKVHLVRRKAAVLI